MKRKGAVTRTPPSGDREAPDRTAESRSATKLPAAEEARRLASGGPTDAERLARAAQLEADGQYEEAAELYRELLLQDPAHVQARIRLGRLYARRREPALALEQFEAARSAAPDDPDVVLNLAGALAATGRLEQGARELKRVLRLHPNRADLHESLGMQYFKRGLYAQAEASLRRAIELDDQRPVAYHHRGEALNQLGRVDEALEMLKRAVWLEPGNARAYYTMGILYDRKHLPREAEAMYRKAREVGAA